LTGITVTNSGSGYSNPTVSITGGGGSGATATATVGVIDTSKQFTGQRLDSTDLYYYNARYYDPTIGRFISPDTVVQNSANPQTLNRYCYCLNNPLKYTDPTGHSYKDPYVGWILGPNETPPNDLPCGYGIPFVEPSILPLEENQYVIVWGYEDSISTPLLNIGYYHAEMIVFDNKGNFSRIEVWGGSIGIGVSIFANVLDPGDRVKYKDGQWDFSLSLDLGLISEGAKFSASLGTNEPSTSGIGYNNSENLYLGINASLGVQISRVSLTPLTFDEANKRARKENYPWYAN